MKRKLSLAALVLMVLLGVYSAVAYSMLRGAGAYRIGTTVGSILARSWQYTALAAVLLLLILAVPRLLRLVRRKPGTQAASGASEPGKKEKKAGLLRKKAPAAAERIQPAAGTAPMAGGNGKIPPAAGTAPMPQEGKIPPAGATAPMPGPEEMPMDGSTAFMPQAEYPQAGETVPMSQERGEAPDGTSEAVQPDPAAGRVCPNCGMPYEGGQRFCAQCGTPLEGGRP